MPDVNKVLAPAFAALAGVPMYLDEFYRLDDRADELRSSWSWLHSADRVSGRCMSATDFSDVQVDQFERLGASIAFEAERLAQGLDTAPDSPRVRAFLMRALSLAAEYVESTFPEHSSWLTEMGIDDLALHLASELRQNPYRALANEPEVVAASEALVSFWKGVLGEFGA